MVTSGDGGDGERHRVTSRDSKFDIVEHRFTKVSETVEGAFSLLKVPTSHCTFLRIIVSPTDWDACSQRSLLMGTFTFFFIIIHPNCDGFAKKIHNFG